MDALLVGTAAPRPHPQRLVGARHDPASCNNLPVRQGGHCGVVLDPPYSDEVRQAGLYAVDSGTVADDVRAWCEANGSDPRYRIVLAGFDTEHRCTGGLGWRAVEWYPRRIPQGWLRATSEAPATPASTASGCGSPHCLGARR